MHDRYHAPQTTERPIPTPSRRDSARGRSAGPLRMDASETTNQTGTQSKEDGMTAIAERIRKQLFERPCWICLKFGPCEHREFQVEIAIARAAEKADGESK